MRSVDNLENFNMKLTNIFIFSLKECFNKICVLIKRINTRSILTIDRNSLKTGYISLYFHGSIEQYFFFSSKEQ